MMGAETGSVAAKDTLIYSENQGEDPRNPLIPQRARSMTSI